MSRYGFSIRTRGGQRVENIMMMALSREHAERRLRQMYPDCSILECRTQAVPSRLEPRDDAVLAKIAHAASALSVAPEGESWPKAGSQ